MLKPLVVALLLSAAMLLSIAAANASLDLGVPQYLTQC